MSIPASEPRATANFRAVRPESVTQQIKNYILLNRLRPGDLMPTETELCAILGVSRSSIREAIRQLATLDIVEVRHGYGTFVGQLSLAPLVEGLVFRGVLSPGDDLTALCEVVDVRVALDLSMAARLAAVLKGTSNSDLDALVDEMERVSDEGESFADIDREFHSLLAARLGNRLVQQLVTAFWEVHTAVYPQVGLAPAQDIDDTVRAHRTILRAAEAGNVDALTDAIVAHYAPLKRALGMD
ncbi:MAG: FadR/GntR family transcriptional regulator [Rhodoglobus sp.]